MKKGILWGIKIRELLFLMLFYFFFAFFYCLTLWLNRAGYKNPDDELFSVQNFLRNGGTQYFLFFVFTVPIWWLVFKRFAHLSIFVKLSINLVMLPLFVVCTQQVYYYLSELWGFGHLVGTGRVWDLYIPTLFYLIQFGFFHAYEYFKENQRKLILEGELRQVALKSELAAIKAQLNPHFLYNVFNTINASVPPEQEQTRQMIGQLSDLFRYQLRATQTELVPLEEELSFVQKYLELEKARFEERLKITIDVAPELRQEQVPPMLLQPIVENSVKHGLASLIEGGTITIQIKKVADKLRFEISDTGVGVKDKKAIFDKGVGLTNTKLRLHKMYQTHLEVYDNEPRGLKIAFSI